MGVFRPIIVSSLVALVAAAPSTSSHLIKKSPDAPADSGANPVVDLGYNLQRGVYNDKADFYNFTNIRYAAPPLGDLRFRKPADPHFNRSVVQEAGSPRKCPQAYPAWEDQATTFVLNYLISHFPGQANKQKRAPGPDPAGPAETEDCLFLDLFVTKKIYEDGKKGIGNGAPVLVWIYGGAFIAGEKAGNNPTGLIQRSNNGMIFIQINYRLGAFGFMGGSTVQSDGTANAGFWDQRKALEWIQKYIHLFGGDPERVTVMGESAGGGGIMHQITAFNGYQNSLFSQAIPQSPGFVSQVSNDVANQVVKDYLKILGVNSLAEARKLPSEKLIGANALQVYNAPYSQFYYGPSVDGFLVPTIPSIALSENNFDGDVRLLLGHNGNEGLAFTNANSVNDSTFTPNLESVLPTFSKENLDFVANKLYPSNFSGAYGYKDSVMRQATATSDIAFLCNTYALAKYTKNAYMYEFNIYPALHGLDVAYTFYNGPGAKPATGRRSITARVADALQRANPLTRRQEPYRAAAVAMQEWITSFVITGKPKSSLGPEFPLYGKDQKILKIVTDQAAPVAAKDDIVKERCDAWIDTLFPSLL